MGSNFIVLPAEFGEENPVHQPRETKVTRGPHRYDSTVVDNKIVGYTGVTYDRSEHEYPKLLYHPKYGLEPKPEEAKFSIGAVTQEQIQNAAKAYQAAMEKWNRGNRTQKAKGPEDEERLLKKGWLPSPPKQAESKRFDMASEEI